MPEIVPATAEMLARFDGHQKTVRAIAAVEGDRVLGIMGFYPQNGHLVIFSGITDETRKRPDFKRLVVKGSRAVMALAKRNMPLLSHADPEIPGSDVLLKHLGFVPTMTKDIYTWPGSR